MNKPTLVFVHGAFSTERAFNYYRLVLSDYPTDVFLYDWNRPTLYVGRELAAYISQLDGDVILIGHSLGGNVSLHAAQKPPANLLGVITIGSPVGGVPSAQILKMFSREPVFRHISPISPHITRLHKHIPPVPVYGIVTTTTHTPSFVPHDPHDGVVSIRSQKSLPYGKYIELDNGHLDVLLSEQATSLIRTITEKITNEQKTTTN
jgi:fermentation-respiration switch protein FrsA (DUF1100 family)